MDRERGFIHIVLISTILLLGFVTIAVYFLQQKKEASNESPVSLKQDIDQEIEPSDERISSGSSKVVPSSEEKDFKSPSIDIYEVKKELINIVVNDIGGDTYNWSNGHDAYISVYKNTEGSTLHQEGYEGLRWTYDVDEDVERFGNFKLGENKVIYKTPSGTEACYFGEFREIGNRRYLIMYYEYPPAGNVGREYKFYDEKNNNLISTYLTFYDTNLRKYMGENAEYIKECETYKYRDFPESFIDFFRSFESEVLKNL